MGNAVCGESPGVTCTVTRASAWSDARGGLTHSTWSGGHPAGLSSQGPSGAEGCPGNQVGGLPCIPTHPGRGKVDGVDEKWEKDSSHFAVQSAVDEGLHSRMFLIS